MKTTLKLSAIALVIALTACSSGDKGSDYQPSYTPTINSNTNNNGAATNTANTDNTTATNSNTQTASNTVTGNGGSILMDFDDPDYKYHGALNSANSDTLTVDGRTMALSSYTLNHKVNLTNSYFGFGWDNPNRDWNEKLVVYSYGSLTDTNKVPTSGTATYKGTAFYIYDESDPIDAHSEFNVDFSNKTVNGRIYNSAGVNETLPQATISGNSFSGWEHERQIRGNFYGANAEELGGTYETDRGRDAVASFGATKQ